VQTEVGAVPNKSNIIWTEGKLSEQILAERSIVLDTSAGFSSVRELNNDLTNFKFCNESVYIGKLFRKFCRQMTYIFLQGIVFFVLNVTYCHLMKDALQITE